ncbi:hypothetical protein [Streptomyces omiyaensis]|uniref:hypothetical protein n=1 Tax=Streptomyces omiyaensis TaxID=68247 RepID=UPI001677722F|nr:hypothetical protein [Streptomyces omiyaensis]GGY70372.1 hypothetical protein GCM10010363_59410 [Streptomyces omiyaensis]
MTAREPGRPETDEELARHVAELTGDDRRHDRRLLWWELLAVLLVAAVLAARALWAA